MKTLPTFSSIIIILSFSIDGQPQIEKPITKGNYYIGGGINLMDSPENSSQDMGSDYDEWNYHIDVNSNQFYFAVYPSFGYFVADGLVLVFSPSFNFSI